MSKKSTGLRIFTLAAILMLIGFTLLFLSNSKNHYTIIIDDVTEQVASDRRIVQEILDDLGIDVRQEDLVNPSREKELVDRETIIVTKAQKIQVAQDDEQTTLWTLQSELGSFLAEADIQLNQSSTITADGNLVSFGELQNYSIPAVLQIGSSKRVTIIEEDNSVREISSKVPTVGRLIDELGINLSVSDRVSPTLNSWLRDGLQITIDRANRYQVVVDGREVEVITYYTKVRQVLAATGFDLNAQDFTIPNLNSVVEDGDTIQIVRVHHEYEKEDEVVAYSTQMVPLEELEIDQRTLVSTGQSGIFRRIYRTRLENNVPVSKTVTAEYYTQSPVNQVIGYGTKIVVRTLDTPDGPIEYWRVVPMRATSYTAASAGKPPDHPGYGITASGVRAGTGVVAIDPAIVPFRSNLYIPGYGVAFAGDTGGGIKGRIIDLGYDEGQLKSWRGTVDVYYLTPVPPAEQINYLLP